jgi:hypothetical protein
MPKKGFPLVECPQSRSCCPPVRRASVQSRPWRTGLKIHRAFAPALRGNQHLEVHEFWGRHFVRWRNDTIEQEPLRRLRHSAPARFQDINGFSVLPIVDHRPHNVSVCASGHTFEKAPTHDLAALNHAALAQYGFCTGNDSGLIEQRAAHVRVSAQDRGRRAPALDDKAPRHDFSIRVPPNPTTIAASFTPSRRTTIARSQITIR